MQKWSCSPITFFTTFPKRRSCGLDYLRMIGSTPPSRLSRTTPLSEKGQCPTVYPFPNGLHKLRVTKAGQIAVLRNLSISLEIIGSRRFIQEYCLEYSQCPNKRSGVLPFPNKEWVTRKKATG